MKRTKKLLLLFLFFCLFLTGCTAATQENMDSAENNYTELTLFSDVSFWNPPVWSFEEGSISAGISKKTGAYLDFTIPPQDASKKLSLMILKDELPDLIVATDKNVINQLIRSGKVWSLQDFFETYCPDSHLLKDFPKDRKQEYIRHPCRSCAVMVKDGSPQFLILRPFCRFSSRSGVTTARQP